MHRQAPCADRRNARALAGLVLCSLLGFLPQVSLFASPEWLLGARTRGLSSKPMCGTFGARAGQIAPMPAPAAGPIAASALPLLINPFKQGSFDTVADKRQVIRMYRSLGLPEDASKETVARAVQRLRRKYTENEQALERVEAANFWIMSRNVAQKEEALRKRQAENRLRQFGDSPRRLFVKYVAGYLPPGVRQMLEVPDAKHFRRASGLIGLFALLGLCVPTQATNFVGLAAASSLGFVYQRNRPEPVKDEMGNAGAVQKLNFKEMGASIALVVLGGIIGGSAAIGIVRLTDASLPVVFCTSCCLMFWLSALFFKVYECFDE